MIENGWRCIAGVHFQPEGGAGAVWLALDKQTDIIHLWDCASYTREPPIMVATGLNAHGRWVPIAWEVGAKELTDRLLDRGCNMQPEPVKETPILAEAMSREMWERMRTGRWKVDKRLAEWLDEYRSFKREDGLVPLKGFPLMSATRYAMADISYARVLNRKTLGKTTTYPRIAII